MITIGDNIINETLGRSNSVARKRATFNFHATANDPLQRMLNALQPGTYVTPHKHENPDKREAFIWLQGEAICIEFYDDGSVAAYCKLNAKNRGVEIPARRYHSLICLEKDTVVYELKDGPYDPSDDKNFAPWAPAEGSAGCEKYLQELLSKLDLK